LVPNAKLELATDKWKEAGRIDVGFHEWRIWCFGSYHYYRKRRLDVPNANTIFYQ
jgi:hypothetical protein